MDDTQPRRPGWMLDDSRNSRRPGVNSSSSGIRDTTNSVPAERVPKQTIHRRFHRVAHDVFPFAGFVVRFGPRESEYVGQETLGQSMTAHDGGGQFGAGDRELHPIVDRLDEAGLGELVDHLRHGRAAHFESLGDASLDHVEIVLVQFEDALAVLLESRMPFHAPRLQRYREGCPAGPAAVQVPFDPNSQDGPTLDV
ncbi:MAG: hypothetical protein RLZ86_1987 [Actinomycetota bacterium]